MNGARIKYAVWAAVAAFLIAALLIEMYALTRPPDEVTDTSSGAGGNDQVIDVSIPPRSAFDEIDARPLFSPSRRSHASADGGADEQNLPFALLGVITAPDVGIAILQPRRSRETVRLREGEEIDGWTLDEVTAQFVIMRQGARRIEIPLKSATSERRGRIRDEP